MQAPQQGGRQPYGTGFERRCTCPGFLGCKQARLAQNSCAMAAVWLLACNAFQAGPSQVERPQDTFCITRLMHVLLCIISTPWLTACCLKVLLMLIKHGRHC